MVDKKKCLIFAVVAYLASGAIPALCIFNPYHMTEAAALLTYKDCLKCHVEDKKKKVSICLGDNCLYTKNHSILHRYPPVGKEDTYAPIEEVVKMGAIFEDDKVTCLSCHNLTMPPPHLIREREKDQLCFMCHISFKSK